MPRRGRRHCCVRALGPIVVVTTVALLGTGIGVILIDRRPAWLLLAHKASFVVWFGAMTVHVVGHALETPALAIADFRRGAGERVPGATTCFLLVVAAFVIGIGLGVVSRGWVQHWQILHSG